MGKDRTVGEYFDSLTTRFDSGAAKGVDAVFQWDLSGEGGRTFYAAVADGSLKVGEGRHEKPTVTLAASADNFLRIVSGELNGTLAVVTRKMKVSGNIVLARKMQEIFPL